MARAVRNAPIRLLLSHSHVTPPAFARTIEPSRLLPPTRILCSCSLRDLDRISLLPGVPAAAPESPYVYLLPSLSPFPSWSRSHVLGRRILSLNREWHSFMAFAVATATGHK